MRTTRAESFRRALAASKSLLAAPDHCLLLALHQPVTQKHLLRFGGDPQPDTGRPAKLLAVKATQLSSAKVKGASWRCTSGVPCPSLGIFPSFREINTTTFRNDFNRDSETDDQLSLLDGLTGWLAVYLLCHVPILLPLLSQTVVGGRFQTGYN